MTDVRLRPARARRRGPRQAAQRPAQGAAAPAARRRRGAIAIRRAYRRRGRESCSRRCAARVTRASSRSAPTRPIAASARKTWLKVKCTAAAGIRHRRLERERQGARLLARCCSALHEDGKLRYAGKVGTGFNADTMNDLRAKLRQARAQDAAGRGAARDRAQGALGQPEAGRRDRLHRIHRRRRDPPCQLPRLARRQEGRRGEAGESRRDAQARPVASVKITNPDRVIFPDREADQGRPRRILRSGGAR